MLKYDGSRSNFDLYLAVGLRNFFDQIFKSLKTQVLVKLYLPFLRLIDGQRIRWSNHFWRIFKKVYLKMCRIRCHQSIYIATPSQSPTSALMDSFANLERHRRERERERDKVRNGIRDIELQ